MLVGFVIDEETHGGERNGCAHNDGDDLALAWADVSEVPDLRESWQCQKQAKRQRGGCTKEGRDSYGRLPRQAIQESVGSKASRRPLYFHRVAQTRDNESAGKSGYNETGGRAG